MTTITFDRRIKNFVLETFDKIVKEGLIFEKKNPSQAVIALDGQEVTYEQFAGIKKGSEIIIKSDLISLMKLCDALK